MTRPEVKALMTVRALDASGLARIIPPGTYGTILRRPSTYTVEVLWHVNIFDRVILKPETEPAKVIAIRCTGTHSVHEIGER